MKEAIKKSKEIEKINQKLKTQIIENWCDTGILKNYGV